jgi:HAMP domain-containing protein
MNLSIETCAQALSTAAINRRVALQIELAVGLGVFLLYDGTGTGARQALCEAYATAGYQCLAYNGIDYKTINRRINACAELFHRVDARAWAGKVNEEVLIRALMIGLEPLALQSISDVHRYCAPAKKPRTVGVKPHTRVLGGPGGHTGQDAVLSMFRRATDQVRKGAEHIETEHLALVIPADTTRDELIELAGKLITLAESKKELLTA